jgi:hypothetical protein
VSAGGGNRSGPGGREPHLARFPASCYRHGGVPPGMAAAASGVRDHGRPYEVGSADGPGRPCLEPFRRAASGRGTAGGEDLANWLPRQCLSIGLRPTLGRPPTGSARPATRRARISSSSRVGPKGSTLDSTNSRRNSSSSRSTSSSRMACLAASQRNRRPSRRPSCWRSVVTWYRRGWRPASRDRAETSPAPRSSFPSSTPNESSCQGSRAPRQPDRGHGERR